MGRLGNHAPAAMKREFVDKYLVPGSVVYLYCRFISPPKDKFLIIACVDPRPCLLVVNSRISEYTQKDPHLVRCQIRLREADYDFLKHDSYVNCTQMIRSLDGRRRLEIGEIRRQLLSSTNRAKGWLAPATKLEIVQAVQGARMLNQQEKDAIAGGLG